MYGSVPVGINLQDLWFSARETLLARGYPEFLVLSRSPITAVWQPRV